MMISTKGRYALRVMIDLAQNKDNGFISLKEICKRQNVSMKYIETIISALVRTGLVVSHRGKNGGYALSKAPGECNLYEIMEVVEGKIAPVMCEEICGDGCNRAEECLSMPVWSTLDGIVEEYLSGVSLQDVIDRKA